MGEHCKRDTQDHSGGNGKQGEQHRDLEAVADLGGGEDVAHLTEDVRELAHDVGAEALQAVELGAAAGRSEFVARLSPRTAATKGTRVELGVDVHRLHFFDPGTGLAVDGSGSS